MASASQLKSEPGIKPDPEVAGASPAAYSEDDIYEDAGDLEFYDSIPNADPHAGSVYLAHVPKYLFDAWAHLDDNDEIRIGTVRQWNEIGSDGQPRTRIAMLLDHNQPAHQPVPKEYHLDIKDMNLKNTFLFTEKNLKGFKSESLGANSDIPPHIRRQQLERQRAKEREKEKEKDKTIDGGVRKGKFQPRYKKAIPKKTVLAGKFRHELSCQPVLTDETKYLMRIRNDDALKSKVTTTITAGRGPTGVIQAGAHVSNDKFSNFIRTVPEPKKAKKQKEEKAARMPQQELRDKLFQCFERFSYWSMKAFKQTLVQPEAWLRENLDELAFLHKTGPFANHWELKREYKNPGIQSVDSAAPNVAPEGDDSGSDADDDNVEMEDVV
ncbi:transcription initiation factor IIF, beta subunit-domain-containing protein [Xylariomycetidae sp. FL2044]|nr:transcription initiation factor IIF, beta subunit-domain-containing protein [Xylariomycetidae sp. FL2044]